MPRRHWFVAAGLLALGHQTAAHAFWPRCVPASRQTFPANPYNPVTPADPANPNPMVQPPTDPANPNPPTQPPAAAVPPGTGGDTLAGNDFLGGQASGTFTPNMFGDFFSGVGNTRALLVPNSFRFRGSGSLTLSPAHPSGGAYDNSAADSPSRFNPNEAGAFIAVVLNGYGGKSVASNQFGLKNTVFQKVEFVGVQNQPFLVNGQTTNVFAEVVSRLSGTPEGRLALLGALNSVYTPKSGQILTTVDSLTLANRGNLLTSQKMNGGYP